MGRGEPINRKDWPESGPHLALLRFLDRVHADNGTKSRREIAAEMNLGSATRVNEMLMGTSLPADEEQLVALVRALGGGLDDQRTARRLFERARAEPRPRPAAHPWESAVRDHSAWTLVDQSRDASAFRDGSAAVAAHLASLAEDAQRALADDPWLDATLAPRFTKRTDWLLRTTLKDVLEDLSPAEAALLTLIPLLHCTHTLRTLAAMRAIDPLDLAVREDAVAERADYELFLLSERELVNRARAPRLPDRNAAGTEIGWWLLHRWLARYPEAHGNAAIRALLDDLVVEDPRLRREVLEPRAVRRLLAGFRLNPAELSDTDRQNAPRPEHVLFVGEPHEQRVRELLLGHLLAVSHAMTIDTTRLPDIVVRHLGIPEPVHLARLHGTAARAQWVPQDDCLVLRADCHHPAEMEGLRMYARRVDTLLHTVRRSCKAHASLECLDRLPPRASSDDVRPGTDEDDQPLFQGASRFRLDERRVQDLLMGEQLYQDRGLAIRELYQNALDACRYRRARLDYLTRQGDWADDWTGRIHFRQGVERGRAFLECRDNGVGMTEAVLTDVFSQAGARFTDLSDFLAEESEWRKADPPVHLYANSRFGIGVLSYFMIADEIEVITRPMGRGQVPQPTLKVSIFGPGHLFRIQELHTDRSPGTTVRLFLREPDKAPSCVDELRAILGIAEFATLAEHDSQREEWIPGVLKPRARPSWEDDAFDAHGTLVPWREDGGGQVIWCRHGGGLLVDGLHVRPGVRRGVLAGLEETALRGAVVNLTGARSPAHLSVDRRQILSDVSADVEALLGAALGELLANGRELLNVRWISAVTQAAPRLGDMVAEAAGEAGLSFETRSGAVLPREAGCFLQDSFLVLRGDEPTEWDGGPLEPHTLWGQDFALFGPLHQVPDHVLVWRLLAHRATTELDALGAKATGPVVAGLPSDALVLGDFGRIPESHSRSFENGWEWPEEDRWRRSGHILWVAMLSGVPPREVARRAVRLGWHEFVPEAFSSRTEADHIDLALLSEKRTGRPRWLDMEKAVPPGHLVAVALQFGVTLAYVGARMRNYGFRLSAETMPEGRPSPADLRLLSWMAGDGNWLDPASPVPASHLVRAASVLGRTVGEVCERLRAYGFSADPAGLPARPDGTDLTLFAWDLSFREREKFDPGRPLPPAHTVKAALALGCSNHAVVDRLESYGIPVVHQVPRDPAGDDLRLLSADADGQPPWHPAGKAPPLWRVLIASDRAERSPADVADRLGEYGLGAVRTGLPPQPVPLAKELCSQDLDGVFPWLDETVPVKRGHILRASAQFGMHVAQVADSLAACGFVLPDDLPETLDPRDIRLLAASPKLTSIWLRRDRPVPLRHLLRNARDLGMSVEEAAGRLRWLGMDVPDVAESVEKAMARVPWSR
ncbi:hypothetical protein [Spirillospora sp. NPDC029432]|uniref:wHTH domain-containing protein n=1 Tax=Spirillospora sp. NPDC029432 TaxID=3154599 RepID=UPI003456D5CE